MKRSDAVKLIVAKGLLGASLAVGLMLSPSGSAQPNEDEAGWSCVDDGNRVCGPDNAEGKPAGCYDDGGVLVAVWPCHVVIDPQTGDSDVYADGQEEPIAVY